jgi:hypothetical protein
MPPGESGGLTTHTVGVPTLGVVDSVTEIGVVTVVLPLLMIATVPLIVQCVGSSQVHCPSTSMARSGRHGTGAGHSPASALSVPTNNMPVYVVVL